MDRKSVFGYGGKSVWTVRLYLFTEASVPGQRTV